MNHFAVKCDRKDRPKNKSKSVKLVDSYVTDSFHNTDSDDSVLMLDCVNHIAIQSKYKLFVHLKLNNVLTKFQLDCGSTVNALPRENYVHIFKDHEFRHVTASDTTLIMFDKTRS